MGPPLPVLAKRPVRLEDGRLIAWIFHHLPRFMESIEAHDELLPFPLRRQFNPSQLPLPECILPRQTAEDDRHLKTEQNAKDTKKEGQDGERRSQRLSR